MIDKSKDIPLPFSDEQWRFVGTALDVLKRITEAAGDHLPEEVLEKLARIKDDPDLRAQWVCVVNQLRYAVSEAQKKGLI